MYRYDVLQIKKDSLLARQALLVEKVGLAAILSVRRIARSRSPKMETKKNGPVGTDGAKKRTAEIGTKEVGAKMTIVPGGKTGMIKSGIVPDGRTGTTLKKMKAASGMVGRAGVADVGCLAKVRWLTRPAASKGSCSQMRIRVGRRSSRRVRSRSLVLSSSLSTVQGLSLGVSSGGRSALLLRCCLARGPSSYVVFVVFGV